MQNKITLLISVLIMVLIFIGFTYFYNQNQSNKLATLSKEQSMLFKRDYSFTIGKDSAKVQLVEFFDPACETCSLFHPYVKQILKENKNDIQLVFRYAPFHKGSYKVVSILEAVKKQDMFLETLELIFKTQDKWASHHTMPNFELLLNSISNLGIDMEQLANDMKDSEIARRIDQDIDDGKRLGATKTPSYYVNGRPLQQFGLNELKTLIQEELNK
jgi:protein-disulfide isomerase